MQTLLLIAAGFFLLDSKPSQPVPPQQPAQPPATSGSGADLGAAFGAFVGNLIAQATKDSN
jgi:hypothetical protein